MSANIFERESMNEILDGIMVNVLKLKVLKLTKGVSDGFRKVFIQKILKIQITRTPLSRC